MTSTRADWHEGMRADLAVLNRNIFAESAGPIADAQVELTYSAGRNVYDAGSA